MIIYSNLRGHSFLWCSHCFAIESANELSPAGQFQYMPWLHDDCCRWTSSRAAILQVVEYSAYWLVSTCTQNSASSFWPLTITNVEPPNITGVQNCIYGGHSRFQFWKLLPSHIWVILQPCYFGVYLSSFCTPCFQCQLTLQNLGHCSLKTRNFPEIFLWGDPSWNGNSIFSITPYKF